MVFFVDKVKLRGLRAKEKELLSKLAKFGDEEETEMSALELESCKTEIACIRLKWNIQLDDNDDQVEVDMNEGEHEDEVEEKDEDYAHTKPKKRRTKARKARAKAKVKPTRRWMCLQRRRR